MVARKTWAFGVWFGWFGLVWFGFILLLGAVGHRELLILWHWHWHWRWQLRLHFAFPIFVCSCSLQFALAFARNCAIICQRWMGWGSLAPGWLAGGQTELAWLCQNELGWSAVG